MSRKRGAQPGNQNARKHGFYSNILTDKEKSNLGSAALVKGLDDEIALLRVKLKSIVEHDPENIRLISEIAATMARLLLNRQKLALLSRFLPYFTIFCFFSAFLANFAP